VDRGGGADDDEREEKKKKKKKKKERTGKETLSLQPDTGGHCTWDKQGDKMSFSVFPPSVFWVSLSVLSVGVDACVMCVI
jgi:hypothetical protein